MGLRLPKPHLPLLLLLVSLLFLFRLTSPTAAEARPLANSLPHQQQQQQQQRISNLFATLGMECKCCDGGECTGAWVKPCSDLQCLPWKLH